MSPFKRAGGGSIQSSTGSRGVRISGSNGSNAGYTMFRGSVKGTGYPFHSPVSPSLPLPCVTVCHHIATEVYHKCVWGSQTKTRIKNVSAMVPDKLTRTANRTGYDTHVTWTCGSVKPCSTLTSQKSGLEDVWHGYSSLVDIRLHNNYSSYTRPSEVQSAAVLVISCHNGDYFSTNFMHRKTFLRIYLSSRQSGNYPPTVYTESSPLLFLKNQQQWYYTNIIWKNVRLLISATINPYPTNVENRVSS